jgi:hypothetical protein
MRRTLAHLCLAVTALACTAACGGGQRHAYDRIELTLPFVGTETAAVLTIDRRQAVVSGQRQPSFSGLYRDDDGEPEAVRTRSGNAFAEDVTSVVSRALGRGGYQVQALAAPGGTSESDAFERLRQSGRDHLVLLIIDEWQTTTFKNTEVRYRLELSVLSSAGALKGQSMVEGSDQLAPSHDSASAAASAAQRALHDKLNRLFAEPKVVEAFKRTL